MKKKILNLFLISIISILFSSMVYAECEDFLDCRCDVDADCPFAQEGMAKCVDSFCQEVQYFQVKGEVVIVAFKVITPQTAEVKTIGSYPQVVLPFTSGDMKEMDLDGDGINDIKLRVIIGDGGFIGGQTTDLTDVMTCEVENCDDWIAFGNDKRTRMCTTTNICAGTTTPQYQQESFNPGAKCDSDGGYNLYQKGLIEKDYARTPESYEDYCIDSQTLFEYSCDANDKGLISVGEKKIPCPSGYQCSDGACVFSGVPSQPTEGCNGCLLDGTCVSFGFRREGKYCDITKTFLSQKGDRASCDNDFECATNICSKGMCIDFEARLRENASLLRKIWCKIANFFSKEGYNSCLAG